MTESSESHAARREAEGCFQCGATPCEYPVFVRGVCRDYCEDCAYALVEPSPTENRDRSLSEAFIDGGAGTLFIHLVVMAYVLLYPFIRLWRWLRS
jgi:hypothetical protein